MQSGTNKQTKQNLIRRSVCISLQRSSRPIRLHFTENLITKLIYFKVCHKVSFLTLIPLP